MLPNRNRRLALGAGAGAFFTLGAFIAHAMMGTPGGATRSVLTFAGTLTDTTGAPIKMPQTIEFDFTNPKNQVCAVPGLAAAPDPNTGAFTVDIPIDACPGGAAFFDGSDITYKITVGTTVVTSTPPPTISPVPYAKYADVAANAAAGSQLQATLSALDGRLSKLETNGARLIGSINLSGCNAGWTTTAQTLQDFPPAPSCTFTTQGLAAAPATNIPAIVFPKGLPAGDYMIVAEGYYNAPGQGHTAFLQFSDGTNSAQEISNVYTSGSAPFSWTGINQSISYAAPTGPITFHLYASVTPGGSLNAQPSTIRVYYFPH